MRIYDISPADSTPINPAGREAPKDPMRGTGRIPAGATDKAPPETSEHEATRWTGDDWEVVPDYRGYVYYTDDGERHEITELGIQPPANALDKAPPAPLAALAAKAIARINSGYTQTMQVILDEYPDAETLSFDKQEREAREWQQWQVNGGAEPATPYIDAMLSERPIGKSELVSRIISKANAFVGAHGSATGRRQRLEDDIKASLQAEDRAALEAIGWSNSE